MWVAAVPVQHGTTVSDAPEEKEGGDASMSAILEEAEVSGEKFAAFEKGDKKGTTGSRQADGGEDNEEAEEEFSLFK